ncbi:MAG: tetratricopeptide repeat protein [Chitinophagales bacterium]|nr:tetratricopeptide repeat protein [Chitinophagales bacterium]
MKKIFFSISLFTLSFSFAFSQSSKVVSAFNYLKTGEFDNAKQAINEATQDPKTGAQAKTWFYRGSIYEAILGDTNFAKKSPEALSEAVLSYKKAMEIDPKNQWKTEIQQGLNDCSLISFNDGVAPYNRKEYQMAYDNFSRAASLSSYLNTTFAQENKDTFATLYAGHAATKLKRFDESIVLYQSLLDKNIEKPDLYQNMAESYMAKGDTVKAREIISKGVKAYPGDKGLMIQELNMYLSGSDYNASIAKLNEAIAKNPDFTPLYVQLGNLYEQTKDTANARKNYEIAIAKDPTNFDSYYRMGALYYNQAVDLNNQMNKLDLKAQKQYDVLKVKRDALFKQALPFLEKAHNYDAKDKDTLLALKELYARLNMMEKLAETKKKLEALN